MEEREEMEDDEKFAHVYGAGDVAWREEEEEEEEEEVGCKKREVELPLRLADIKFCVQTSLERKTVSGSNQIKLKLN